MDNKSVRTLNWWEKNVLYPLKFAMGNRRSTWGALIISVAGYVVFTTWFPAPQGKQVTLWNSMLKNWFDQENHINIFLQFLTLFVVTAVWFAQLQRDWRESLDKFLSVEFTFKGNIYEHLSAKYAPLFSTADIRLLGQSMGQVRNNNMPLPLDSSGNKLKGSLCIDRDGHISCQPFWLFEITMPLRGPLQKENKVVNAFLKSVTHKLTKLEKDLAGQNEARLSRIMGKVELILDEPSEGKGDQDNHANN